MNKFTQKTFILKNVYSFLVLSPLIFLLYACPFSSPYRLNTDTAVPVDEAMLGKWATLVQNNYGKEIPVKMILSRKNDTEYNIDFTGYLYELVPYRFVKNDSIRGTAFMSIVSKRQLLNIEISGQVFITELLFKEDKLSILVFADGFTSKYLKSDQDLRIAVEFYIKTRVCPVYDDAFSLKEMVRVN